MQDRPTASELLEAIGDLLEGPLMEATGGGLKHQVRVAGNLCRILGRELELAPGQDLRELELLSDVLGVDAEGRSPASLNEELAAKLRGSTDPELKTQAWHALTQIVRGKLAIAKPGHSDYDFSAESEGDATP